MDGVAARREARRRKILENSTDRLRKIASTDNETLSTVSGSLDDLQSSKTALHNLESTFKVERKKNNDHTTSRRKVSFHPAPDTTSENSNDLHAVFHNPTSSNESVSDIEFTQFLENTDKISYKDFIVVIIAMVARYLHYVIEQYAHFLGISVAGNTVLNNIFLPLILYEVYDFTFFKPPLQSSNSIINTILLLSNIQLGHIGNIITAIQIAGKILQDVSVYFFTFVTCDLLIEFIAGKR